MTSIEIKQHQRQSLAMKVTPGGIEVLIPHQLDPASRAWLKVVLVSIHPNHKWIDDLSKRIS